MNKFIFSLTIALFLSLSLISCNKTDNKWYKFNDLELSIRNRSDSIRTSKEYSHLSYKIKAALSDIPLPDIKEVTGKARFLRHDKYNYAIGYKIKVIVDSLKQENIPKKYLKERTVKTDAGNIKILPLQEVLYELVFQFTLLDEYGFKIKTIESKKHNIRSGKINIIKARTEFKIPPNIVNLTKDIRLDVLITKCVSCE